tara:strand:+ start:481 stop:1509 length:1029 start_codon:yes stop_codon:yes gene_type:complete
MFTSQINMAENFLTVKDLKVFFPLEGGWKKKDDRVVKAVDGISFNVKKGEILAVVGESGCGKTTIGRAVVGLNKPTSGTIELNGNEIYKLSSEEKKDFRKKLQMVFQDPYDSMNPRKTAFKMISEPLLLNKIVNKKELFDEVLRLLEIVGLSPSESYINRARYQLSGGERQRLSIARSISVKPELIVADEPVSALDISIRGQILSLIRGIQKEFNISFLFISHDLSVVRSLSDRVIIVYLGKIAEEGTTEKVFKSAKHPYTIALLAAHPIPDPKLSRSRKRIILRGDVPSPIDPPKGCRFHTRCPISQQICIDKEPEFINFEGDHNVACHFAENAVSLMQEV